MDEEGFPLEYSVFALALRQEGAIGYFAGALPPECVGIPHGNTGMHQFYVAMLDYHKQVGGSRVDDIAFKAWLEGESDISDALGGRVGVNAYFGEFSDAPLPDVESLTALLRHRANKRRQLDALQNLQMLISKKEHKTDYDNEQIHKLTDEIRFLESELDYNPLDSVTTGTDIARKAETLWDLPSFLPTQYPALNKAIGYSEDTGGFVRGAVHAILAPSGQGKSTLAKNLMNHWVDQGLTVLFVNYEEAEDHWERILFTQITRQNVYASGYMPVHERAQYTKKFVDTMESWGDRFIVRHDPDSSYFEDLERWLYDILGHNETIPDVVIIDTIQSMFTKAGTGGPRWGQYEEMMVRLERLAKQMNAAFIITAQENTNRMKEKREAVIQSDAGGSISIIQKCSVTIFITKQKLVSEDDAEDDMLVQLQIPKNRIAGQAFVGDPPVLRYDDTIKSYVNYELVDPQPYDQQGISLDFLDDFEQ